MTLKTHIEFRSDHFPRVPNEIGQEEHIWGYRLAQYLSNRLVDSGFDVSDFIKEDWGYLIPLKNDEFKDIWIGCNHYAEFYNGFLVFINPFNPIVRKGFFKKIDISDKINQISQALEMILMNDSLIYAQRWWLEEDMKLITR